MAHASYSWIGSKHQTLNRCNINDIGGRKQHGLQWIMLHNTEELYYIYNSLVSISVRKKLKKNCLTTEIKLK